MTDSTLDQGGAIQEKEWESDSHWVKRTVAVAFFAGLIITLAVVFTRVIGARIPEQRATLEKLITDRTGLVVRFDNVHFAWDLDGTSAVFTRVELTDPKAGRVRVVAPELRVEFDAWDFLRHHQFSLGHVTLKSPDIEITGDPEESMAVAAAVRGSKRGTAAPRPDERLLVRQYLRWAELMPVGRIEVEGARVHLLRRGQSAKDKGAPRHSFTLSQAVVSRGNSTFNAHGTLLLSQDVGQSLFVSAKLDGLGPGGKISGDLRVIARRVFLQEMPFAGLSGRGTLDARIGLRDGRIDTGSWQASAREIEMQGADRARFDHVSASGKLRREANDVLLEINGFQVTRGSRLERAPALSARLAMAPGRLEVLRTTARAEKLPLMAAEFIAGVLEPRFGGLLPAVSAQWTASAGELRDLHFDSGLRTRPDSPWSLSAQVSGLELTRADRARLSQLTAQLRLDPREISLRFDPRHAASFRFDPGTEPRPLNLGGELLINAAGDSTTLRFAGFSAASDAARVQADGHWNPGPARAGVLRVKVTEVDRALLADAWSLLSRDRPPPDFFADVTAGKIVDGKIELLPEASGGTDWSRSSGTLEFADLATGGVDMPRVSVGAGSVKFARGGSRLDIRSGQLEDLTIRSASLERPRSGAPRLRATLAGNLDSPVLRAVLESQGLERLKGNVELETDARGELELRDPGLWRVTARVSDASAPLGGGLPPLSSLAGTIRYSAGQLRGVALAGNWLGGSIEVESRRTGARALTLSVKGEADAAPLLELLGQAEVSQRVNGRFAWTGTAQPGADGAPWRLTVASNLDGVESGLPEPFGKTRARDVPVEAELAITRDGIRDFSVESGSQLLVRGKVTPTGTQASFQVQGISGDLHRPAGDANPEVRIARLDLARATQVLAATGALLPADSELTITVDDSRQGGRSLGALHASISRQESELRFALDTPAPAIHQLEARGQCVGQKCSAQFTADTRHLAALLGEIKLPAEWPVAAVHATGSMDWQLDDGDAAGSLAGRFDIQAEGASRDHQLTARATLANGQIDLTQVQGSGPEPDLVFRGNGRIGLAEREYDLTVDYERISLAATAVPSTARAPLTRAWNAVRGSVARRGWTEAPVTRRVQWHGTWD
jgi:hypothetical protein